jgi:ATP-binding cassette, subfamily C (CFTR/MRP), member 1
MLTIQHRISVTTSIFSSIKGVKMTGLTSKVQSQLQTLRSHELDESKRFRRVQIAHVLLGQLSTLITPALTFAAFTLLPTGGGGGLDVSIAFTTLSLLNLLISPVASLIMIPPTFASAAQCFAHIQDFLNEEKREDFRLFKLPSAESDLAVRISRGSFGWAKDEPPVLKDVSVDIPRTTLNIVVGPVASGKSTFLKSLAGETRRLGGSVACMSPRLAYCDQEPWILNLSIGENILGGEDLDQMYYERVVRACQLEEDFRALPEGDETVVGSAGASLSGGQKHRIVSLDPATDVCILASRLKLMMDA